MDREKLIKDIEQQISEPTNEFVVLWFSEAEYVLELLKEQEAKNVVNMTLSKDGFLIASCPKCNALLTRVEHKNYCGYCGQAVKWE